MGSSILFPATLLISLLTIVSIYPSEALPPAATSASALDALLRDYAFRALPRARTDVPYDAAVQPNVSGVKIAVLRLRSGSFRRRGFRSFKEFELPKGVAVRPAVRRLALVYQNLGNWSAVYYPPPPGYQYLTPVLGLLAYNATKILSPGFSELDVVASSSSPIHVRFSGPAPSAAVSAKCVRFSSNGSMEFEALMPREYLCSAHRQGHFAIVVNKTVGGSTAPGSSGRGDEGDRFIGWKIAGLVIAGFVSLALLAFSAARVDRWCRRSRREAEETRSADSEEGGGVSMAQVGAVRAPKAAWARTRPILEDEYMA